LFYNNVVNDITARNIFSKTNYKFIVPVWKTEPWICWMEYLWHNLHIVIKQFDIIKFCSVPIYHPYLSAGSFVKVRPCYVQKWMCPHVIEKCTMQVWYTSFYIIYQRWSNDILFYINTLNNYHGIFMAQFTWMILLSMNHKLLG
jgi:hypothetical protein